MTFEIIKHNETETVVHWFPDWIDKIVFGYREHVATYVPDRGGYKLWNTNKTVRKNIVPPNEFFESIKTQ